MTSQEFLVSYGKVVKMVSDQVDFVVKKGYLGPDGKWDNSDLVLIVARVVPLVMAFDDFKNVISGASFFLDTSLEGDLLKVFDDNFSSSLPMVELVTEEIYNIVLSVIKITMKLSHKDTTPVA